MALTGRWDQRTSVNFIGLDADLMMAEEGHIQILCGERCLHQAIQNYADLLRSFAPDLPSNSFTSGLSLGGGLS
jgi:hypothetical protein